MSESKSHISKLIGRYLRNELRDEEKQELEQWLMISKNKMLFNKLTDKNNLLSKSFEYDNDKPDLVWNNINKHISNPFKFKILLKYAAAILLPILVIFLMIDQSEIEEKEVVQETVIKPGEKNAVIYFADGQVVDLKKDTSKVILSSDKLMICREGNDLVINSEDIDAVGSKKMNKIITPSGTEYNLTLPDGTKVWLNSNSQLEFPSSFSNKQRVVIVKGEMYFDVTKDANCPFIVKANDMQLQVLGTEFNIRAYQDEKYVTSTLIEGSVKVSNKHGESLQIEPGKKAVIKRSSGEVFKYEADIHATIAWKEGQFYFDNKRIEVIMRDISRWYNVDVFYFNNEVRGKRFTIDIPRYINIDDVLLLMEGTGDVKFEIENNSVLVK